MKKLNADETREILERFLPRTLAPVQQKSEPDTRDIDEIRKAELDELHLKNRHLHERINDIETNREIRKKYAFRSWAFLCSYSMIALLIILMSGFEIFGFRLDGQVLSVIAGSTAVSAIGLVHQINKSLFDFRHFNSPAANTQPTDD